MAGKKKQIKKKVTVKAKPKPEKKESGLAEFVRKLEARVKTAEAGIKMLKSKRIDMRDNWKRFANSHLGSEADDGRIGSVRLSCIFLTFLLAVTMVVATQAPEDGDKANWGVAAVRANGDIDIDGTFNGNIIATNMSIVGDVVVEGTVRITNNLTVISNVYSAISITTGVFTADMITVNAAGDFATATSGTMFVEASLAVGTSITGATVVVNTGTINDWVDATGAITGATLVAGSAISAGTTVSAATTITGATAVANIITANDWIDAGGAITGATVTSAGAVGGDSAAIANAITGATVTANSATINDWIDATGAVTGGTLVAGSTITAGTTVSASTTITGATFVANVITANDWLNAGGAVTGASIQTAGVIGGDSAAIANAITGATVAANSAVISDYMDVSGVVTGNSVVVETTLAVATSITGATVVVNTGTFNDWVDAGGAITGATVVSAGAVSGDSAAIANAITSATVVVNSGTFNDWVDASGAITGATIYSEATIYAQTAITGATVAANSVTVSDFGDFSGAITAASANCEGALTMGGNIGLVGGSITDGGDAAFTNLTVANYGDFSGAVTAASAVVETTLLIQGDHALVGQSASVMYMVQGWTNTIAGGVHTQVFPTAFSAAPIAVIPQYAADPGAETNRIYSAFASWSASQYVVSGDTDAEYTAIVIGAE